MLKRLYNPSSIENRIRRSVSWMQKYYRESFDVSMLAADADMSEATYCRHFKRFFGDSPKRHVQQEADAEASGSREPRPFKRKRPSPANLTGAPHDFMKLRFSYECC